MHNDEEDLVESERPDNDFLSYKMREVTEVVRSEVTRHLGVLFETILAETHSQGECIEMIKKVTDQLVVDLMGSFFLQRAVSKSDLCHPSGVLNISAVIDVLNRNIVMATKPEHKAKLTYMTQYLELTRDGMKSFFNKRK